MSVARHANVRLVMVTAIAAVVAATALSGLTPLAPAGEARAGHGTYTNPLDMSSPVGPVENCADPTVAKQVRSNGTWVWWMYCTKDPRNDEDRQAGDPSRYEFQLIPIYSSRDLVNWRYRGNVFQPESAPGDNYPDWAHPDAGLFAPEIKRMNGQWYLYYSVTDMADSVSPDPEPGCPRENSIGVATAPTPLGPWTDSGDPVVDPRQAFPEPASEPCAFAWFWTIDPEINTVGGQRYMFWGSYFGGVFARELSFDGLETDPNTQVPIAIANKFEGPEVVRRGGFYYLFLSATNCCNGPLTGYSVFAARSPNLLGPYVDADGVPIYDQDTNDADPSDGRVGGTPVLTMNGNRFVGPGHNTVFADAQGKHWTIYHAVDDTDPYFADAAGFTKRPAMLDPVVWVDDWPRVRAGRWASANPMPAPAAQPGQHNHYRPIGPWYSRPNGAIPASSDEFEGTSLDTTQWSWIREPAASTYGVSDGTFRFDMQKADLHGGSNNASVLVQDAPSGEWILDVRMKHDVPAEGCPRGGCYNFSQAGVVI